MIASDPLIDIITNGEIKDGMITGCNILVNSTLANSLRTSKKG